MGLWLVGGEEKSSGKKPLLREGSASHKFGRKHHDFEVWEKSIPINGLINWYPIGLYPHISGVIPYLQLGFGCFLAHFAGGCSGFLNYQHYGPWVLGEVSRALLFCWKPWG